MELFHKSEVLEYMLNKRLSFLLRNGMLILFFMVLLAFGATYFIYIPDTVTGKLELSTANPPKPVVTKTIGRIVRLPVQDKSPVKKGQIVAIMESLADTGEVNKLDQQLQLTETAGTDNSLQYLRNISIDHYNNLGELQNKFELFKKVKNDLSFALSEQSYKAEQSIAESRMKAINAQLQNENHQLVIYQRDFDIAKENFENAQSLFQQKVVSKDELKQSESIKLSKELSLSELNSQIINTENKRNDLKDQMIQLNKQIEGQKNNFVQAYNDLKSGIAAWKQEHFLEAPEAGVISFAYPVHENETVQQGAVLFYIIPGQSNVIGNLKISQANFGKVKVGQPVKIKLDGYNYQEYGSVNGIVNSISEIPVENFYLLQVSFPEGLSTTHRKSITFKYGLTGSADIILDRKRLLDKLVIDNFRGRL